MRNCIIMGSGRSGTSMTAGCLAQAGYFMGENLYAPGAGNPKGYFESPDINGINDDILAESFGIQRPYGWLARLPLEASITSTPEIEERIRRLTARGPFCFKDPRFSYTLPVWRPNLNNALNICVFRDPGATALSMIKECRSPEYRNAPAIDIPAALEIWADMYRQILIRHSHRGDWLFFHYDQILRGDGLDRLSDALGAEVDRTFPSKKLNRIPSFVIEMGEELKKIYEGLCELAHYNPMSRPSSATLNRGAIPVEKKTLTGRSRVQEDTLEPRHSAMLTHRPVSRVAESVLPNLLDIPVDMSDYKFEYGCVPIEELRILCAIVRNRQPWNVFEIGTFTGVTTLCMAANCQGRIYTLDLPPRGHRAYRPPTTEDRESGVCPDSPGIRFCGSIHAQRIEQILADSQIFDYSPYFGKIDMVFVDACHQRDFVLRDSMNAFKMLAPGGMIVWQDYADYAPGVMEALKTVNDRFPLVHIAGTSLVVYMDGPDSNRAVPLAASTTAQVAEMSSGEQVSPGRFQNGLNTSLGNRNEQTASAKAALLAQIARAPGDVDTLIALARMAQAENKPQDALAFLQDALILNPDHQDALSLKELIQ